MFYYSLFLTEDITLYSQNHNRVSLMSKHYYYTFYANKILVVRLYIPYITAVTTNKIRYFLNIKKKRIIPGPKKYCYV